MEVNCYSTPSVNEYRMISKASQANAKSILSEAAQSLSTKDPYTDILKTLTFKNTNCRYLRLYKYTNTVDYLRRHLSL